jgi:hypothetical protein
LQAKRHPLLFAAITLVAMMALTSAQQDDTLKAIDRAVLYVAEFVERFSRIVAEEVYVQERLEGVSTSERNVRTKERRELTSDFLFVRTSDTADWLVFRDVRVVDRRAVRSRENALLELFTSSADQARALAERLAAENARHSLSNWPGMNNPLIALSLLQDQYRHRFRFTEDQSNARDDTVVVRFREQSRPTLLRAPGGGEIILQGRLWIDPLSGRVSQTELAVGTNIAITTMFGHDSELDLDVPVEMRERYSGMFSTGVAKYSKFRTFQVETQELIQEKSKAPLP